MRRHATILPLLPLVAGTLFTGAVAATAQAGVAVGVTAAGEALVLRPSSGRGRAGVLVFSRGGSGEWPRVASLEPGPGAEPYEGFGSSLAAGPGLIAVAAADAEGLWGARLFRRSPTGAWAGGDPVPLVQRAAPAVPGVPAPLDMAALMRIMAPPARVVALGDEGRLMAIWGAGPDGGIVRVLRRTSEGAWDPAGSLPAGDSAGSAAPRLAFAEGRVVVGSPELGAVGVFALRGGHWALEAELRPEAPLRSGFGAAVASAGDRLAVGAPGLGKVFLYVRAGNAWTREAIIDAPAADAAPEAEHPPRPAGGGFAASLAWSGEDLWIGAPFAHAGRGAVHRYVDRDGTGAWVPAETFAAPRDLHPGAPIGLGYALAAADGLVVAGAPALDGGAGGAVVIERRDGAWRGPVWLETGVELRSVTGEAVRCADGEAAGFACGSVDLLSFLDLGALGAGPGERVTDIWGWADPDTGREYALVGRSAGMALVDVTRPAAPRYVGLVEANRAGLRDIKVYRDHAFFVGDGAGDHGLVVFDLRRIRDIPEGDPAVLEADARYTGIGSAHNLVMEAETGLAVAVGASGAGQTCGGGLHMVDVSTPTAPEFAGCYTDTSGLIAPGRTHDAQCVIYRGPDRAHQGRRICLASNETALRIVDVTDPAAPVAIARASYPGVAYTHQGWLTEDQRHFFMNDELDELVGLTDRTRTLIWDVADLDDPVLVGEHLGPDAATDHNLFIRGDRMYQANYQGGLRVVDISDPESPRDIGFFDTTPYGPNHAGFGGGAWTAYPFLPSGTVLVSSMYEGLFMLRPRPEEALRR